MHRQTSAGFERTKRDVIRVVHIGAGTLAKRVTEFAGTSASSYTFDDFEVCCGVRVASPRPSNTQRASTTLTETNHYS
jgi:hypothetical protein